MDTHNQILTWAKTTLKEKSYNIFPDSEIIQETPWSTVIQFHTDQGDIYLKQTPPNLFIEPEVINTIHNKCDFHKIPSIIEINKKHHCFLMTAVGNVSLRTYFDGQLKSKTLIEGIKAYKNFQVSTQNHLNDFLKIGSPDWRLQHFPDLYSALLTNEQFLKSENIDQDLKTELQKHQATLNHLCEELASFEIKESLNHSDLHDNNLILDLKTNEIGIVDLGETAIDHPFFSLAACMRNIVIRYHLKYEDNEYQYLKKTLFEGWLPSIEKTDKAMQIIDKLLPIYLIFAHKRLAASTDGEKLSAITRMNDRIKQAFEWFIKVNKE